MTTKNWAAQAVLVNRFSGKVNRKRALIGKANPLVRAAAIEALESRQMLSAAPTLTIAGATTVNEGSSYALSLNASAGANLTSWSIDWGDGSIATPDVETVVGSPASIAHVYTDGPSSHTITATGTNADGTFAAQNAAGVAVNNGTLDPTFGSAGKVIAGPGNGNAVLLQSDGKILVGGVRSDDFLISRFNSDGSVDSTFGTGGSVVTNLGAGDQINAMTFETVQVLDPLHPGFFLPETRIVAVGDSFDNGSQTGRFALARYKLDGSLDASFGVGGTVLTQYLFSADDRARSVAINPLNGDIVVGGTVHQHSNVVSPGEFNSFALASYLPNGAPDPHFGVAGLMPLASTPLAALDHSELYSISVLADGKIVGAGVVPLTTGLSEIVARFKADGSGLDTSFGSSGIASADTGSGRAISVLAADGSILVAGFNGSGAKIQVGKFSAAGVLDSTFGTSSQAITGVTNVTTTVTATVASTAGMAPGQGISVAGITGFTTNNPNGNFTVSTVASSTTFTYIVASAPTGTYISGGTVTAGGVVDVPIPFIGGLGVGLGLQSDGKIVLGTSGNDDFTTIRLTGAGALDSTYGSGGIVYTDLGGQDLVGGLVIDGSDRIVVAGRTGVPSAGTIAVVRYGSVPSPLTVQVNNVAPTVAITGDSIGVRGQPRTESITVADPSSVDMASASSLVTINWGDATAPTTMTFSQFSAGAVAKQHVYAADGTYTITVTATDKDGGATTKTKNISITPFAIEGSVLAIGGVTADDTIFINPGGGYGIKVKDNGTQTSFNLSQITEIDIFQVDADGIFVAGGVKVPVYFYYYDSNGVLVDSEVLH